MSTVQAAAAAARTSLGPQKQIEAGALNVGYVEAGPATGSPVVLLHGRPYDIHAFADVSPVLASAGYRVVVLYLPQEAPQAFAQAILEVDQFAKKGNPR